SYRDLLAAGELPTALVTTARDIEFGQQIIDAWKRTVPDAGFYTYLEAGYPAQLLDVWDFPPFVFLKGDQSPLRTSGGDIGVSVVGSRRPSAGAKRDTARIVRGLIGHSVTIVSGLADGIDQTAHRTALEEGARTVGVIGTGIDQYYPRSSRPYQEL